MRHSHTGHPNTVTTAFKRDVHNESACMILRKKSKGSHTRLPSVGLRLILVLDSQPAGDASHKPGGRLPLLFARPAVTLATQLLKGLLQISLLGEQRHDGREQYA